MKKLKVYGGRYPIYNNSRMVVAAYSKADVCRLTKLPSSEITKYWCITGNDYELSIAVCRGVWLYDAAEKVLSPFEVR